MIKLFTNRGNALFGYQLVLIKNTGTRVKGNKGTNIQKREKAITSKDLRQARNEIILARKLTKKPNYFYQKRLVKKISCTK